MKKNKDEFTVVVGFDNEVDASNAIVIGTGLKVDQDWCFVLGIDGNKFIEYRVGEVIVDGYLLEGNEYSVSLLRGAFNRFLTAWDETIERKKKEKE